MGCIVESLEGHSKRFFSSSSTNWTEEQLTVTDENWKHRKQYRDGSKCIRKEPIRKESIRRQEVIHKFRFFKTMFATVATPLHKLNVMWSTYKSMHMIRPTDTPWGSSLWTTYLKTIERRYDKSINTEKTTSHPFPEIGSIFTRWCYEL